MIQTKTFEKLSRLFEDSATVDATDRDRFVILSDLHVGDGGPEDEFARNSSLALGALEDYYLRGGFRLVLNGDIEELHKFSLRRIRCAWPRLYDTLGAFRRGAGLTKIAGNHDADFLRRSHMRTAGETVPSLRLRMGERDIMVFHGHQASRFGKGANRATRFALRWLARPLGIRNYSVAYNNAKKYRIEKRVYDFARQKRIVAVIGHTHRPLFESLSRIDYLKFNIEQACRAYSVAPPETQEVLQTKIRMYQREIEHTLQKDKRNGSRSSVYSAEPVLPCLFNSGCVIGKRGITAIEIAGGRIALVHWFDRSRSSKYFDFNGFAPEPLGATDYFRVVLKEDALDYIFARIMLLS